MINNLPYYSLPKKPSSPAVVLLLLSIAALICRMKAPKRLRFLPGKHMDYRTICSGVVGLTDVSLEKSVTLGQRGEFPASSLPREPRKLGSGVSRGIFFSIFLS